MIDEVLKNNIYDVSILELVFVKLYLKIHSFINKSIFHYVISILKDSSLLDFLHIISKPIMFYLNHYS